MTVRIRPLDDAAAPAWDRFVRAMPDATFCHLSGWAGVIGRAFGHPTHYAFAEQDGAVVGVLPLVHMRTRLFGNTLSSTPFCVYGGPVAAMPEAASALENHALDLQRRLGAPALEFRRRGTPDAGWQVRPPLYYTFRKTISITGDDAKDQAANIPRKQRAEVRKAARTNLTAVTNLDVDGLYPLYAESVRNLGSPTFPRRYFRLLAAAFPGACDVTTVRHGDQPVAAVLSFHFREEVLPYYAGSVPLARKLSANEFMYWEVMRRAARERGATVFDFGRSKADTGAFDYKKNWGFVPEELPYCYRLAPGAAVPDNNPNNPRFRLAIAAWKRLPLPVANLLGPPLVRGLG
ncbi:FemAB family XrtA/PEP-CTERM system-associated protein [Muricoccus radiodurans]|uniref:FemAB family XrtA/PEP-CTERM system-associated protein n=1 Tax=Muricoccus radiodurans TaxID=2231721 RepID=UPI003CF1A261